MKYHVLLGLVFILILGGLYFFLSHEQTVIPPQVPESTSPSGVPTFTWSYRESEKDSIPYVEISLTATYDNSVSTTKVIDTVEGSCNAYEDADPDTYERSSMIICYYAGLGRYFKVVEEGGGYIVQRRVFEEASPEYNPPQEPYETMVQF